MMKVGLICDESPAENKLNTIVHKELHIWTRSMHFHDVSQKVDPVYLTACCNCLFWEKTYTVVLIDPDLVITGAKRKVFRVGRNGNIIDIE